MVAKPILFRFESISSTNDTAFKLLDENYCVAVTAEFQKKGRGRNNKNWLGAKGENLYYTFGIKHSIEEIPLYMFQIIGGLVAFRCLEQLTVKQIFRLKYPKSFLFLPM